MSPVLTSISFPFLFMRKSSTTSYGTFFVTFVLGSVYHRINGMELDVLVNTAYPKIEEDLVFPIPQINWDSVSKNQ